jgi:ketosteroid isomerase-like protein
MAFVAEDAVFLNGGDPLDGRAAIAAHWRAYFTAPAAPFAWAPDRAEVLASGELAATSGPVTRPDGRVVARFASVWRRQPDGRWRIVFDDGHPVCGG